MLVSAAAISEHQHRIVQRSLRRRGHPPARGIWIRRFVFHRQNDVLGNPQRLVAEFLGLVRDRSDTRGLRLKKEGREFHTLCPPEAAVVSFRRIVRPGSLQPETDSHLDLERQLAVLADRAASIFDLEPVDIAQGLARLGDRVADRLLDAVVGHPDHFNNFVGFVRHEISPCVRAADGALAPSRN